MRGRRDKGIQKWNRGFRDILVLVFNIFLRPFSTKDVIKLIGLDRRYLLVLRSGSGDFKGLPELKTGIKAKVIETK